MRNRNTTSSKHLQDLFVKFVEAEPKLIHITHKYMTAPVRGLGMQISDKKWHLRFYQEIISLLSYNSHRGLNLYAFKKQNSSVNANY